MKNFDFFKLLIQDQVDHVNPQRIELFDEYRGDPASAKLFIIIFRHSEIKMVIHENKATEFKVIQNDNI